jgi:hypothetical protein
MELKEVSPPERNTRLNVINACGLFLIKNTLQQNDLAGAFRLAL